MEAAPVDGEAVSPVSRHETARDPQRRGSGRSSRGSLPRRSNSAGPTSKPSDSGVSPVRGQAVVTTVGREQFAPPHDDVTSLGLARRQTDSELADTSDQRPPLLGASRTSLDHGSTNPFGLSLEGARQTSLTLGRDRPLTLPERVSVPPARASMSASLWPVLSGAATRLAGAEPMNTPDSPGGSTPGRRLTRAQAEANLVRQHEFELLQEHFARWLVCLAIMLVLTFIANLGLQIWLTVEFLLSRTIAEECGDWLRVWVHVLLWFWGFRLANPLVDRFVCAWHADVSDPTRRPPARVFIKNLAILLFDFVWTCCLGLYFVNLSQRSQDEYCRYGTVDLRIAARTYVFFRLVSSILVWLNLVGLKQALAFMMRRGLLRTTAAAPFEAIERNTEMVKVSLEEFDEDACCAICIEEYKVGELVAKTKLCGHVYHKQCLRNWMNTARTCPICRQDLGILDTE